MQPGSLPGDGGLSMSSVLRALHKQRRQDRIAHLRSIDHDAAFVRRAHDALGRPPLLANLRCGAWYAPPTRRSGNCYFKSTDGHAGCWDFSLSRLNLQVALAANGRPAGGADPRGEGVGGGAMIVDSTRSGKRYPDALSKTVPIWCCVINRAVARSRADRGADAPWDTALRLPPWVPPSEASQIEGRLGGWVDMLLRPALAPVLDRLVMALDRPLRPGWLCPPTGKGARGAASSADFLAEYASAAHEASERAASAGAPFAWVHCVCASETCTAEQARERASYT
jgi:tRNA A64-2'-O-ribosylphosphate transferase